ncbi:hypothetical protein BG004_001532, partial [Podila humilis]
ECPSGYKSYCMLGNLCLQVYGSSRSNAEGEDDKILIDYDAVSIGAQALVKALTMRRGQNEQDVAPTHARLGRGPR